MVLSNTLRGAFINTEPALCSIHESGRQVFECIVRSATYDLDYIDFHEIDQARLAADGELHLKPGLQRDKVQPVYDFWVLNYHNATMAPHFSRDLVARLRGPKFAIVLEVEPSAPLAFAERGAFDGYIVLDPSALPTHEVFPFPRPLTATVRRPIPRKREIPVIGSFGMGTPGKGFELVVEAVNREFDHAIVRINVPASTYADGPMFAVHGESYAGHLKRLCEYIAKPGIEVQFTQAFMDDSELLSWCGANDLNLFLYTRRQSGLSATTDQAVASGRPLLVSSNDTFRHIHPYIAPYPLTSLKEAIAEGAASVSRMQKDWSREAFAKRFLDMLEACNVISSRRSTQAKAGEQEGQAARSLMLVARSPSLNSADIFNYPVRVKDALRRTGERVVVEAQSMAGADLAAILAWHRPETILTFGDVGENLSQAMLQTGASLNVSAMAMALSDGVDAGLGQIARRPLVPYSTSVSPLPAGPPQICIIGFGRGESGLEGVIAKIQRELGGGVINIVADSSDWAGLRQRIEDFGHQLMFTPGVEIRILDLDRDAGSLINFFGQQRVIVFGYDVGRPEDILSLSEIALTTERAVVFAGDPFPQFEGREPRLFDYWIPDLFAYASAVQIGLVSDYGEGAFLAFARDELKSSATSRVATTLKWRSEGRPPAFNAVVGSEAAAWYADDEHANDWVRPLQPAYLRSLLGFGRAVLKRFGAAGAAGAAGGVVLVYGPMERLPKAVRNGYPRLLEAESMGDDGEAASLILGLGMLSEVADARNLIRLAYSRLKPDGIAAFGFFFRDVYAQGDNRENVDFPAMTLSDIDTILEGLPIEIIGGKQWVSNEPILNPDPFVPPPMATLVFRKLAGAESVAA